MLEDMFIGMNRDYVIDKTMIRVLTKGKINEQYMIKLEDLIYKRNKIYNEIVSDDGKVFIGEIKPVVDQLMTIVCEELI